MNIENLLLSLNSYFIKDVLLNKNEHKVIVCYEIKKIYQILKLYLEKNIKFVKINNNNAIITVYENNEKIKLYLYYYTMSKYHYNSIDGLFDCNLLYTSYNGLIYIYNDDYNNLTYDDINNRIINKRFCYLINNFYNMTYFLNDNKILSNKLSNLYFNKITYAVKLIKLGWIMDEYYLKDLSWTINYWKNYKTKLNLIKFNNDVKIKKRCELCNKKFKDNDIVFNMTSICIDYNCLISKICN